MTTSAKQRNQAVTEAEEARLESQQADIRPSLITTSSTSRTATGQITTHENATSTPHRYGLRARRASQGSFSTPSRCGRTASRQKLQQQLQQRNNVNGGGAAAIRIGFQLDFGIVPHKGNFLRSRGNSNSNTTAATNNTHDYANSYNHNHSNSNNQFAMASGGKWREEQVLVICPGSRTTMAQLGCGELSPPHHRIPTRMFRDEEDSNLWRPYYTYKRVTTIDGVENEEWVEDVDEDKGAVWPIEGGRIVQMDAFLAFLDHVHGLLTTTYHNTPIMLMASPQWTRPDCEAIARYIFEKTKTPALCLIHSGIATQYGLKWPNMTVIDIGYEKVDVTAIHDGRVINHMDLGRPQPGRHISGGEVFTQKLQQLLTDKGFNHDMAEQLKKSGICEVLPYAPSQKNLVVLPAETADAARSAAAQGKAAESAAAESTTADGSAQDVPRIEEPSRTEDVAMEDNDGLDTNVDDDGVLDVATIVTSGQTKEFLAKKEKEKEKGRPGRKPKADKEAEAAAAARPVRQPNSKKMRNTFSYEEIIMEEVPKEAPAPIAEPEPTPMQGVESNSAAEGVAAAAPAVAPTESTAEPVAVPATEGLQSEKPAEPTPDAAAVGSAAAVDGANSSADSKPPAPEAAGTDNEPVIKSEVKSEEAKVNGNGDATTLATAPESKPTEAVNGNNGDKPDAAPVNSNEPPELRPRKIRREIEVGLERFLFADRDEIDRIVTTIYRTIQGVEDMYMRPACWDNLVFVGNGSRLRGLKDNILQTLQARHIISPSTATMFTSELPSNVATPAGTGAQTPVGNFAGAPHQLSTSSVNPLLQAATTASTFGIPGRDTIQVATGSTPMVGSEAAGPASGHHFHSQTPTSIKTIALPTYLSEWSKNGFEEAMFLGAQVASRIAFCLHSNMDAQAIEAQKSMSLSRVDYK
ncbi:SWI/SNF and RSC complexes subunit arp9 [Trichoderma asperellum]|uniref:SWI/SNF and RSC complexes subunit arp9 n=1 Tax=Trichoderma asperellum TaxID=101201 RepID=A0A6V8QN39_TRIAP|nr:SWI/SNF and RSC complexes subunit arp9 [Trichoderma asperellum]